MDLSQAIDAQEKSLARLLEWIRHADSKSQILITLNLAMIGGIVAGMPTPDKLNVRDVGFLLVGAGPSFFNLMHCLHATSPRTITKATQSSIYFGLMAKSGLDQYLIYVSERTQEEYLHDLNEQCYANAKIADKKYRHIRIAVLWTFRCILLWLIAVYLLYRWK